MLPLSFRLILFDTSLLVKNSLAILIHNGTVRRIKNKHGAGLTCVHVGIVSAPLWDSQKSAFAGLLTTSDYMNVIQYYWQNPDALARIDQFQLNSLRGIDQSYGSEMTY